MKIFPSRSAALAAFLLSAQLGVQAAPPVIEDPLREGSTLRVKPTIPVGKTLVLPLPASDADGDVLSFSVKSSDPQIMARVRTGCPILRVRVSYAGDPNSASPGARPFSGDLEFQLFRDATPVTSNVIGGAAQAGFYDNLIFHRVISGFVAQTGDPQGTGSGNPGFTFEHEFRPELIFSGRGQLAMANSQGGYSRGQGFFGGVIQLGNFDATNGSQFFITTHQPRFLDFKHTIFGQLIRGFDVLDKIAAVPVDASSKPLVPVKMLTATVVPGRSDATLLLSATDAGPATITVTAIDPSGAKTKRRIAVVAKKDKHNNPPLIDPIPNLLTSVGTAPSLPLKGIDLEHDFLLYRIAGVNPDPNNPNSPTNTAPGSFGSPELTTSFNPLTTPGSQTLAVGVAGFNDPLVQAPASTADPFAPFDAYRFRVAEIGYGDRRIEAASKNASGVAGAPLSSVVLAEFSDADSAGAPTDFIATVNWGDGSPQQSNTGTSAQVTIARSPEKPGALVVRGTHTYARPGIYAVEVVVDGLLGAVDRTRSQIVVHTPNTTLRALGSSLKTSGATLNDRLVATFSDTTPGVQAQDFSARVDWGDGSSSAAKVVANGAGEFGVLGTHTYRDPETFAVQVFITRAGEPPVQTVAWSRIEAAGFKAPRHLPPFPAAHLVGQISPAGGNVPFQQTIGRDNEAVSKFAISIVIVNSGNVTSKAGKLRFYLSRDEKLNTKKIRRTAPGTDEPADVLLKIGTFEDGNIPAIAPGGAVNFTLTAGTENGQAFDFRLGAPKGNSGAGDYILAHFDYSDPLADQLPISRDVTFGRINGINVNKRSLVVEEAPGPKQSKNFKVSLARRPASEVKIPLTLSTAAEITLDKTELTFTSANWDVPQVVTATAKDDTLDDNSKDTFVLLGPALSTDVRWNGMSGGNVRVTALDNDPL